MSRLLIPLLGSVLMTGCLKEPTLVPPMRGQQTIMVDSGNMEVCLAPQGEFDHYELYAPLWADSVEWFQYVGNGEWISLGTDTVAHVPAAQAQGPVHCLVHVPGDTADIEVNFYECYRFVMVPTAFDRWQTYGGWKPVISSYPSDHLEYLHWQVRSLDGTLLFETHSLDEAWDGGDDGQWIGTGTFLYHIRVRFAGEDELVFTGMFVKLG